MSLEFLANLPDDRRAQILEQGATLFFHIQEKTDLRALPKADKILVTKMYKAYNWLCHKHPSDLISTFNDIDYLQPAVIEEVRSYIKKFQKGPYINNYRLVTPEDTENKKRILLTKYRHDCDIITRQLPEFEKSGPRDPPV